MDRIEMSNLFDVLFNNITSNQAPGINEFEKSVFLTKAQNQLVMEYFNQRVDQVGGGFDGSQKRQYDFSTLIKTAELVPLNMDIAEKIDRRSQGYLFPSDYFLSVNESIWDSQYQYSVMPIDYNEYYRLMQKPFAFPPKKTVWRLITGNKTEVSFGKKGYSMGTRDKNPITITYMNLPHDEEAWYNDAWFDATMGIYEYQTHGGETETYDFPDIADGLSFPPDRVVIQNGYIPFKYELHEGNYEYFWARFVPQGIILLHWGATNPIDDNKVAEIIPILISAFEAESNPPQYALDGFTLHDLVQLEAPENEYNFDVAYSEYTDYPASAEEVTGPTGLTLQYNAIKGTVAEVIGSLIVNKNPEDISYRMRYVHQLNPIILTDLSAEYGTDVKIDGKQEPMDCELPEESHEEIVERAVTLAKIAWAGGTATQAAAQQRNREQ